MEQDEEEEEGGGHIDIRSPASPTALESPRQARSRDSPIESDYPLNNHYTSHEPIDYGCDDPIDYGYDGPTDDPLSPSSFRQDEPSDYAVALDSPDWSPASLPTPNFALHLDSAGNTPGTSRDVGSTVEPRQASGTKAEFDWSSICQSGDALIYLL